MRWLGLALVSLVPLVAGQNSSEHNVEFIDKLRLKTEDAAQFAVRADNAQPETTPLPLAGVAATIKQNQTHFYSINLTKTQVNYSLSLSECARKPDTEKALRLVSGQYSGTTDDGGLLQVYNTSQLTNILAVSSPESSTEDAEWSYQIGIDNSATYFNYDNGLFWVDSDFANSLFVTEVYKNFSSLLTTMPYPNFVNSSNLNETTNKFNLFLYNTNDTSTRLNSSSSNSIPEDLASLGKTRVLGKSFCAMQSHALLNQNNADFSTTTRSNNVSEQLTRGQFLFTGLNSSTSYEMFLAIPPRPGFMGGMLFPPVPFHTKTSTSCQLIYNMTTCPNNAFSVPGNASTYTVWELTRLYDQYVGEYSANFTQALAQINCNAKREDMFSVFSTCEDCRTAYQDWLCTVAVPRCEDWSNTAPYLQKREPGTSRNNMINEVLRPGRYKEVLPCYWLCNNLAMRCPLSMGFGCPSGKLLNESYGFQTDNGDVSCSYPGAVYKPDKGVMVAPSWALTMLLIAFTIFI